MKYFAEFAYNDTDEIPDADTTKRILLELSAVDEREREFEKENIGIVDSSIVQELYGNHKMTRIYLFPGVLQITDTTISSAALSNDVTPDDFFNEFFNAPFRYVAVGTEIYYDDVVYFDHRWKLQTYSKFADPYSGVRGLIKSTLIDTEIEVSSVELCRSGIGVKSVALY